MKSRALLLLSLCWAAVVHAHTASNGFLSLHVAGESIDGVMELAIRDAELAVGLDRDNDNAIRWGELRAGAGPLDRYVQTHLTLSTGDAPCRLSFKPLQVNERTDGNYAWLPFSARCETAVRNLTVAYRLLDDIDPSHRGLLTLSAGSLIQTAVLGGDSAMRVLSVDRTDRWKTFIEYSRSGIWHIWSGIDHLLFLLALLLPAVVVRRGNAWEAVPAAAPAFANIVKVVTAFTAAHSITLTLAALDVVRLPSRWVESVIALSIVVAALNTIFPRFARNRWHIAFAFGLLHGFGFASVLADMGLPEGARVISLLAFNVGVEAGQLAVVALVMPLAYALRDTSAYRRFILPWGSAAIAALALVWFVQRALLP